MIYYSKVFLLNLDSMEKMIRWMLDHIPDDLKIRIGQHKIELAFEELLINVYEHGYHKNQLPIFLYMEVAATCVFLEIRDIALEFDPLSYESAIVKAKIIEQLNIGGRGVKLVKAVLNNIRHCFENRMNLLKIEIK